MPLRLDVPLGLRFHNDLIVSGIETGQQLESFEEISVGDRVIRVNGDWVHTADEFISAIQQLKNQRVKQVSISFEKVRAPFDPGG